MLGEHKTPGGKLVRVEFDVADGHLRGVAVSGDFFLYPEEALGPITAALEGMPAALSEPEIAARVAAAIPAGTEWLGTSAEALAIAVGRALSSEDKA
jgi:lipoate-protein ligase A